MTMVWVGASSSLRSPRRTCSLSASSSAVRFLEFMRACPHCGQSTTLLLHSSQSRCPSGHW